MQRDQDSTAERVEDLAEPISHSLEAGDEVGAEGWRLVEQISQGRTGTIWRAERDRGGEGAVKLFHVDLSKDERFGDRFSARAQRLSQVSHPVVIPLLEWGHDQASGAWYVVTPLVEGESLRARLKRAPLDDHEVRGLARSIAAALIVCHRQGCYHQSLTPEHILLPPGSAPLLIDFDLALVSSSRASPDTFRDTSKGDASPEDAAARFNESSPGAREDMFSLGMTLAESLGARAGDAGWADLISLLTHFMPDRRPSAQMFLKRLNEVPNAYHIAVGDQSEGPLRLDDIVAMILAGQEEVYVWWPGASEWCKWDQVIEILIRVEAEREPTIRLVTKSPFKPPMISLPTPVPGDRASQTVEGVTFHERLIPPVADEDHTSRSGQSLWIMETQVTQELYSVITGRDPSKFKGARRPVERVNWSDGITLCNLLSSRLGLTPAYRVEGDECELIEGADGYRLPFEYEWEWAARAERQHRYAGSDDLYEVAWYGAWNRNGNVMRGGGAQEVALLEPNAYGLYDMSGNVWEWCADDYDHPGAHRSRAKLRSRRGGSWGNDPSYCQIKHRSHRAPSRRYDDLGLRLCRLAQI